MSGERPGLLDERQEVLAFRVAEIEPERVERRFFRPDDVIVFVGHEAQDIASGHSTPEATLRSAVRGPISVFLVRRGQVAEARMDRGSEGLVLEACAVPAGLEEGDELAEWVQVFRDQRGYYPLLSRRRSPLAACFPLGYFFLAGAWRQLTATLCFCAVGLMVSPLFLALLYAMSAFTAWTAGPELVAADYRYYDRRAWAKLRAATPAALAAWVDTATTEAAGA